MITLTPSFLKIKLVRDPGVASSPGYQNSGNSPYFFRLCGEKMAEFFPDVIAPKVVLHVNTKKQKKKGEIITNILLNKKP